MSTAEHFAYFELLKVSDDPIIPFLEKQAGDAFVHFNPAHQTTFLDRLSKGDWTLIAGRFNAANQGVRNILDTCRLFTIVQDPIERFYVAYIEARSVKTHPLNALYSDFSLSEAAQYCIDQRLDYGRNSQCQILSGGYADTAAEALAIGQERFDLIVTPGQTRTLIDYLKKEGLVSGRRASLKVRAPSIRNEDRKELMNVLSDALAEDISLYRALK